MTRDPEPISALLGDALDGWAEPARQHLPDAASAAPPRIHVAALDCGVKVFITWPDRLDAPATTVLHGPGYGLDHLGYTPDIPAQATEYRPVNTAEGTG